MSDLLHESVRRNLSDKLYEKRKAAALEVEQVTKHLAQSGDMTSVGLLVNLLVDEFALSPQANHRKGGLIGLAAATVGLATHHTSYLGTIVPPVLRSFTDQDSRVRYYACEALYNIAKVARGDIVPFFNDIFDALCKLSADADPNVQNAAHLLDRLVKDIVTESNVFSIGAFIPLLRERLTVLNPYVRQFLVSWITVLDSVPGICMLEYLPEFLDGLLNMLSDPNREIRQQADAALAEFLVELKGAPSGVSYGRLIRILVGRAASADEFTRLTAISWLHDFIALGHEKTLPFTSGVLEAVLPCLSHGEERIREMALRTNALLESEVVGAAGFDITAVLAVIRGAIGAGKEPTRLAALRWVSMLLGRFRADVLALQGDLAPALLQSLSDASDQVVLAALEVLASLSAEDPHFQQLLERVLAQFRDSPQLLETRGALVVRLLCRLLGADRCFRKLAAILQQDTDARFAGIMVQALNLILLTAAECAELRATLKRTLRTSESARLFGALYDAWCHSAVAAVSLCLLAHAYDHAADLVYALGDLDGDLELLVQVDQLVQLLETPVFAYLRMQLLQPARHASLLRALYGLLMLLPQTTAFNTLQARLQPVTALMLLAGQGPGSGGGAGPALAAAGAGSLGVGLDAAASLERFRSLQIKRQAAERTQAAGAAV